MRIKQLFKIFFAISFVFILVLTNFEKTYASELKDTVNYCESNFSDYETIESKIIESNSGNTVYELKGDLDDIAKERNIPLEKDGRELAAIAFSYTDSSLSGFNSINETLSDVNDYSFTPFAATATKIKVTSTGEACGMNIIRSSYYPAGTATMSISESVTSTASASISVSKLIVEAGVGFTIGKSYTVSDSYSVKVPKGKTYNIVARPTFLIKQFNILAGSKTIGSGEAKKPTGVCFTLYK